MITEKTKGNVLRGIAEIIVGSGLDISKVVSGEELDINEVLNSAVNCGFLPEQELENIERELT